MITELSHTRCETFYDVNGTKIRLWAIVGGQLAVALDNHQFSKRLNKVVKFTGSWSEDEAPKIKDIDYDNFNIETWVEEVLALQELRFKRLYIVLDIFGKNKFRENAKNEINYVYNDYKVESKRFHDKENRTWFSCELRLERGITPVTASSRIYAGRCEDEIRKWASKRWVKLMDYLNPIFDKNIGMQYEEISEEDFNKLIEVYKEFASGKD